MPRGQDRRTMDVAQGAFNRSQAQATGQQAENEALRGGLLPAYQSVIDKPLSEAEEKQIRTGPQEAIASTSASAADTAANRMARTRNPAGAGELLDELARERGKQSSEAARQSESDIADLGFRRKMAALGGESNIYGIDTGTLREMLRLGPEYLGVMQRAGQGQRGGFGIDLGPLGRFGVNY